MPQHRRRFPQSTLALAAAPALSIAQPRIMLKADDQKGGLRALLEAAGVLKGVSYDIQWTEFPATVPLAGALNTDAVNLGPIGDTPAIFVLAAGTRVKLVGANRPDPYGTAVLVRSDSPLNTTADLEDRSIGASRGSIGHFVALKALESTGLDPDNANFRSLPFAGARLALVNDSIDAQLTWEPYIAMAGTTKHVRVLINGRGLWSRLSCLAATDTVPATERNALGDFLQRVMRVQVRSYQHVDSFSVTLARIIGITSETARLRFARRQTVWHAIDPQLIAEQQYTADFYVKVGLLK